MNSFLFRYQNKQEISVRNNLGRIKNKWNKKKGNPLKKFDKNFLFLTNIRLYEKIPSTGAN